MNFPNLYFIKVAGISVLHLFKCGSEIKFAKLLCLFQFVPHVGDYETRQIHET
jgi:hypothetical protein